MLTMQDKLTGGLLRPRILLLSLALATALAATTTAKECGKPNRPLNIRINDVVRRYVYDQQTNQCESFPYMLRPDLGDDRFEFFPTMKDCADKCVDKCKVTPPLDIKERSDCNNIRPFYYYNSTLGTCATAIVKSCGDEPFDNLEQCKVACGPCLPKPAKPVTCGRDERAWWYYYDADKGRCRLFLGCRGEKNLFRRRRYCREECEKTEG